AAPRDVAADTRRQNSVGDVDGRALGEVSVRANADPFSIAAHSRVAGERQPRAGDGAADDDGSRGKKGRRGDRRMELEVGKLHERARAEVGYASVSQLER